MKITDINTIITYVESFYNVNNSTPQAEVTVAAVIIEMIMMGKS